jgi:hypothetical protein
LDKRSIFATFAGFTLAILLCFAISSQSTFIMGSFGIVLTREGTVVVSDADIKAYDAVTHELFLTDECAQRLRDTRGYLEGPFTVIVNGDEIINGLFVPPIISRSYPSSQIVITYPTFDSNYGVMKIQMGYPWDEPVSPDPRDNPRVGQYFEATGRLLR